MMAVSDDRQYFTWRLIVLLVNVCDTVSFVHLLSRGQQLVVDVGDVVPLECEFYTDDFNLFDNPILWRKTQLEEETQMNMMGNLMEPYSSTKRLKVTFIPQPPRYVFGLTVTDIQHEDSGNYTCEVNGPHNVLLGSITHYIYVRSPIERILLINDNTTDYMHGQVDDLVYTETQPGILRCVAVGGYPPSDIAVYVGRREVTGELGHAHSARLTGSRGLRIIEYVAERWAYEFSPRATDDGKMLRCVATVSGLPSNATQARVVVNYAPIITCFPSSAFLGDRNAFLRCDIKARPWVTALYWILDLNGTTIGKAESVSEYWTKVMDRSDGTLETSLYMRQAKQENFRIYTLIVENSVGVRSQQIQLVQKLRTTPAISATPRSSYSRKEHGSSDSRYAREKHNGAGFPRPDLYGYLLKLLFVVFSLLYR